MAAPAHPIPASLEPVLALINSMDVEEGTDDLAGGPDRLSAWLSGNGLLPDRVSATRADLRLAIDLRTGLRALAW